MGAFPLRDKKHLAYHLDRPLDFLEEVAGGLSANYEVFDKEIGGKRRHLYNPNDRLRIILVAIKDLLREEGLPSNIVGGTLGGSLRKFAQPHVRQPAILKLDIKNFYPSTKRDRIFRLFSDELGCSPEVADLLKRLTTTDGHLPQGFNTSCDIGNIVIRRAVERLAGLAEKHEFAFTVWVDNFVLSGDMYLADLQGLAVRIMHECGFELSQNELVPNTKKQSICGITVNQNISADRAKREEIEAEIEAIAQGEICTVCPGNADKYRQSLSGRINAVGAANKRQGRRLMHLFKQTADLWPINCRCG